MRCSSRRGMIRFWEFTAHRCPAAAELGRSAKHGARGADGAGGDYPRCCPGAVASWLPPHVAVEVALPPLRQAGPPVRRRRELLVGGLGGDPVLGGAMPCLWRPRLPPHGAVRSVGGRDAPQRPARPSARRRT